MFEKEATQYALEWGEKTDGTYACCRDGFIAGAEFGFQKGKKELEEENAKLKAKIEELKKYYEGFEVVFNFKDFMNGASGTGTRGKINGV